MSKPDFSKVQLVTIASHQANQRLDNFLLTFLKGVPKSRIYNLLRKGEIRVNKKRQDPSYRLQEEDVIRLPPIKVAERIEVKPSESLQRLLSDAILYDDEQLLIINKPSGVAVHAGTEIQVGVIEALKQAFPQYPGLQLAHRLDRDTSGCLLLAKNREALLEIQSLFINGKVSKIYQALAAGRWNVKKHIVQLNLQKNVQRSGERMVEVMDDEGKFSETMFSALKLYHDATLLEVKIFTGRTHQIRVHAQHEGHPLAGDNKYGDKEFNRFIRRKGLKRLFLHAQQLSFKLPSTNKFIHVEASLPEDLEKVLLKLEQNPIK